MAIVFGAIAPHGGDIVSQLAADPSVMERTRAAMVEMGRRCALSQPETVVVLTPHGMIQDGAISVGGTKHAAGILGDLDGKHIKAAFETDLDLSARILDQARLAKIPTIRLVGEKEGEDAVLPLDWGALIPLWYAAHPLKPRPRVVVCAPDRRLPRELLVRFGVGIARAAAGSGKRVALIASCDLGHAHDENGPYGFHPASAEHDAAFCEILKTGDFGELVSWPDEFLELAKVDAFWQTIILAGALGHTPLDSIELLSYEAPTYFGMAVATYQQA